MSLRSTRLKPVSEFARSFTKIEKVIFILIVLYAGFSIAGHSLFFAEYPVQQVGKKIILFTLFCALLSLPAFALLYFMHVCKGRLAATGSATQRSTLKLYVTFLSILTGCWLIYLIGFFPGNMSPDSFDEWRQALGITPLNDHHPILYVLIMKTLLPIWNSPAIIALLQIVAMAAVLSSFFVFLYKAGIPFKWLMILVILTGIFPANGIMAVVLWKDILFCCCLVWLTLVITEIVTNNYIFNQRTTLVCLVVSLLGVALLRHNGVLAALAVALVLAMWAIKSKRKGVTISIALFLLVFFTYKKVLMPYWFKVPPVPSAFQKTPLVHGIASVMHYNGELTKETREEMEKLLPDSVWKSLYNPYSADEYLFTTNTPFIDNLSAIPTSKVLSLYTNTFLHNPFLLIKDRLNGSELLWNVNQAEGASNYSYETNIEENEFGIKHNENGLQKALRGLIKFAGGALDPVSRRAGLFNILLLLLLLYLFKQRKTYLLIFLPLIGANMSLLLSMTFQAYRYVYYIPLLFIMIALLAVSNVISPNEPEKKSVGRSPTV